MKIQRAEFILAISMKKNKSSYFHPAKITRTSMIVQQHKNQLKSKQKIK